LPSKKASSENKKNSASSEFPEPKTFGDAEVPPVLQNMLYGELFLVRYLVVEEDRCVLFTSKSYIEKLAHALLWLIDGTFRTLHFLIECLQFMLLLHLNIIEFICSFMY
jgi:hypothetical protein